MLNNYICALDIGSSKIAGCLAKIKRKRISDIFFESIPSKGIRKGAVVNSIDVVNSVGGILKSLKSKSGVNIKFIYTNISGQDIVTRHSRAIIPLAERGNKVITLSDIRNVNEQARILGLSLEEEIIHSLPFSYTIDSKNNVLNPLGLYSHRLEVDLYLACVKSSSVQSFIRAVNQAGYEIKDLFFSGIATSEAVFDKELKEGVSLLCDIGGDITELALFKDGVLRHIEILPFGGDDLTAQLQDALKIPFDLSQDIKHSYASVGDYSQIKEDREVLVKKGSVYKPIKHKLISEIVTAKTKLMCSQIRNAVEKITPCNKIDNFAVVGRMPVLEGFLEALENALGVCVKFGRIAHPQVISLANKESALSGQKYLNYATALGIICQALKPAQPCVLSEYPSTHNPLLKIINKAREVYQEYF